MSTLALLWPVPIGVVVGPLSATPVLRTKSRVFSGKALPESLSAFEPASAFSQEIPRPSASTTRRAASTTSVPIPSPEISVTRRDIHHPCTEFNDVRRLLLEYMK